MGAPFGVIREHEKKDENPPTSMNVKVVKKRS